MNGPQRTACLAKGCNNGKYKWIEVLVMGKKQWKLKHPYQCEVADKTRKTDGHINGQYAILSLAGSQNLCQTMIFSVSKQTSQNYNVEWT